MVCGILMYLFVHGEGVMYLQQFDTIGSSCVSVVVTDTPDFVWVIDGEESELGDYQLIFGGR